MRVSDQSVLMAMARAEGYVPWQVLWDLTYACQLRCSHCYQMNLDWNRKGELPTDRILETLDELHALGTQEIVFSGGDPFVRRDFSAIVERACGHAFQVIIFSSGQVIKPEVARHLAGCGVASVEVTLLGADAETHDTVTRRPGSFVRLLRSVSALREVGVPVVGKVIVSKLNVHQIERMAALCRELGIEPKMDAHLWRPWNGSERQIRHLKLDAAELGDFYRMYRPPKPLNRTCAMGVELCNAGRQRLGITPFGKVNPCTTYGEGMVVGDLQEESITSIWQRSPALERYRQMSSESYPKCHSCTMSAFCDWCPGLFSWAGNAHTEPYDELCEDTGTKKGLWEERTGRTWKPLPVVNNEPVAST